MNNTFKIENDGKEYKIIKILAPKNSENRYIIYTDDSKEYYASRYTMLNDEIVLHNINEEYEWNYIDERIKEIKNDI